MIKYASTFGLILGLLCSQADAAKKHQDDCDVSGIVSLAQKHATEFLRELEKQPSNWHCFGATEVSDHKLAGLSNFWQFNEHTSKSKNHFPKDTDTEAKRDIYRAAFIWQASHYLKQKEFTLFFGVTPEKKRKAFLLNTAAVQPGQKIPLAKGTSSPRTKNGDGTAQGYTRNTLKSRNLKSDASWTALKNSQWSSYTASYDDNDHATFMLYPAEAFVAAYLGTSDAKTEDQWALAQKFFPNLENQINRAQFDNLSSAAVRTDHLKQILCGTLELQYHQKLEGELCKAITEQKENNLGTQQESTEALQDMVRFAINLAQAQKAKSPS